MSLQDDDTFKISKKSKDGKNRTVLAWFTKETTTCKEKPRSCGQLLGEFSPIPINYTFTFERSSERHVDPQRNAIWVDVVNIYQQTCKYSENLTFWYGPDTYMQSLKGHYILTKSLESGIVIECEVFVTFYIFGKMLFVTYMED